MACRPEPSLTVGLLTRSVQQPPAWVKACNNLWSNGVAASYLSFTSILNVRVVPPGVDSMLCVPPRMRTRSAMPGKPSPAGRQLVTISQEAMPVVADCECARACVYANEDLRLGRAGMFEDVIERLLHDAVEQDLVAGREEPIEFVQCVR